MNHLPSYHQLLVAVSGIRDIEPEDADRVVAPAMQKVCDDHPLEIRFGGARGVDTIALAAALRYRYRKTQLTIIVPGFLSEQPPIARRVAERALQERHTRLIELELPLNVPTSFTASNIRLLHPHKGEKVDALLAFRHSRQGVKGGTLQTMKQAKYHDIPVVFFKAHRKHGGED